MEIVKANSIKQVYDALKECAGDLHDQSLNNETDLKRLSEKFFANGTVFTAYESEKIVGFIAYYRNNFEARCAYLSMIACKKKFWGKGIAAALYDKMYLDCKKNYFVKIRLQVAKDNMRAINFYRRRNFKFECSSDEKFDYYVTEIN